MKPFEHLDLSAEYIRHGDRAICHDHPTEPDKVNAGVKQIEAALKTLDVPVVDGVPLLTLQMKNLTHNGEGVVSIDVATLENPVTLGSLVLRDNAGTLEQSGDGGDTWGEIVGGGEAPAPVLVPIVARVHGPLSAGLVFDDCLGKAFTLREVTVLCKDTGSGGSALSVDVRNSGISVFDGASPLRIEADSGTYQTDSVDVFSRAAFAAGDILEILLDAVPTDAEHGSVVAWIELS